MNIVKAAMGAIGRVNPNIKIKLIRRQTELINGIDSISETSLDAIAQMQPVKPNEAFSEGTYLTSADCRKFYINGNRAEVISYFENPDLTNSAIEYKGKRYTVFSKADWSLNGWIKVIGVLNERV